MNVQAIPRWALAAALAMTAATTQAEPISALVGLAIMEKASQDLAQRAEPGGDRARRLPWRTLVSAPAMGALRHLRTNPAIGQCVQRADAGDPVAGYHVVKLARFGALVEQARASGGGTPTLANLPYQRPARAYRWCVRQAGVDTAAAAPKALEDHAAALMGLLRRAPSPSRLAAARPGQ